MIKSFILLASILLTGFSSFGQSGVEVPIVDLQNSYRGCCIPIKPPSSCCAVVTKTVPTIYTEQVVQRVQRSEEALDITDPEISGLVASPNPTKGYLNISVPPSLIGYEIRIIDMTGRFVGSPILITGTTANVNLEGESGAYIISIRTEKQVITERIMLNTN